MATLDLKKAAVRCVNAVPAMRNGIIFAGSLIGQPAARSWVRFAMYHDVTADERADLTRQMRYLRNVAEFVSIDDAVQLAADRPDGRYMCVTFDDGFAGCYDNALPVLQEFAVPAAFFVIPGYIDGCPPDMRRTLRNRNIDDKAYITWDQCRALADAGMTIGSHTYSHVNLIELSADEVADEMARAKATIERHLDRPCEHFAAPWGLPEINFRPDRDPTLARAAGYKSFFTTVRGNAIAAADTLPRERLEPSWGDYHLRFFLSQA